MYTVAAPTSHRCERPLNLIASRHRHRRHAAALIRPYATSDEARVSGCGRDPARRRPPRRRRCRRRRRARRRRERRPVAGFPHGGRVGRQHGGGQDAVQRGPGGRLLPRRPGLALPEARPDRLPAALGRAAAGGGAGLRRGAGAARRRAGHRAVQPRCARGPPALGAGRRAVPHALRLGGARQPAAGCRAGR